MAKVKLMVSVAESHLDPFENVVKGLKKAGLDVTGRMASVGVATGSIEAEKVGALQRVKGVEGVEESRESSVAPPDSPVQ